MGYCVHLSGHKFRLPATKMEACLNGMLNSKDKWVKDSVKDAAKRIKHFAHLPANIKLVELVYSIWGFKMTPNEANDIFEISYELEKMHAFDEFLDTVAPFVDPGYLEFSGENSARWRYVFRDGSWKEVKPVITWPE